MVLNRRDSSNLKFQKYQIYLSQILKENKILLIKFRQFYASENDRILERFM